MKKKQKKIIKRMMKEYKDMFLESDEPQPIPKGTLTPPLGFDDLDFQVIIEQETNQVYVKIAGFDHIGECKDYANYLAKFLPLLLYKTEVMH